MSENRRHRLFAMFSFWMSDTRWNNDGDVFIFVCLKLYIWERSHSKTIMECGLNCAVIKYETWYFALNVFKNVCIRLNLYINTKVHSCAVSKCNFAKVYFCLVCSFDSHARFCGESWETWMKGTNTQANKRNQTKNQRTAILLNYLIAMLLFIFQNISY